MSRWEHIAWAVIGLAAAAALAFMSADLLRGALAARQDSAGDSAG